MFFNLFKSSEITDSLKPKNYNDRNLFLRIMDDFKERTADAKKEQKRERLRSYALNNSLKALARDVKLLNRYGTQGLMQNLVSALATLHVKSRDLLLLEKDISYDIAAENSLSILENLDKEQCSPWMPLYKFNSHFVYFINSQFEIPEYVFCTYHPYCSKNVRYTEYDNRLIVSIRIAMEMFLETSLALQWYNATLKVRTAFLLRLIAHGQELEFLLDRSHSREDIVDFEQAREEGLLGVIADENNRVMIPCNQPFVIDEKIGLEYTLRKSASPPIPEFEVEAAIEALEMQKAVSAPARSIDGFALGEEAAALLSDLETRYPRKEVYFALLGHEFEAQGHRWRFKEFWSWLEAFLSQEPFMGKSLDGHSICIDFSDGRVIHTGLLNNSDNYSSLINSGFRTNVFPKLKPIISEIHTFCSENNISHILNMLSIH